MINLWEAPSEEVLERAKGILAEIECTELAERPWLFLSQGERQRVLIGRSLMAQPPLLILDEPCAGLDPVAREHFLGFVDRLAQRENAPTLVLVTHHVEEVIPVFNRVMLMQNGRISACGDKEYVLSSNLLGEAFHARIELLDSGNGRYEMRVGDTKGRDERWKI